MKQAEPRFVRAPGIRRLFVGRTQHAGAQFVRYAFVGALSLAVDVAALVAFTEMIGLHYLVSAAIGFGLGLLVNYAVAVFWVFAHRRYQHRRLAEFGIYAGVGIVGLGINESVMYGFTELVGLHYAASKLVSAAVVLLWNFGVRRTLLFRSTPPAPSPALSSETTS